MSRKNLVLVSLVASFLIVNIAEAVKYLRRPDTYVENGLIKLGDAFTDVTTTVSTITVDDNGDMAFSSIADLKTANSVGTANTANGVVATEFGHGRLHSTLLTLTAVPVGSLTGGANANGSIGIPLYTLPAGAEIVGRARLNVALTGSTAGLKADTPDVGLGMNGATLARRLLSEVAGSENIVTGQTATNANGTAAKAIIPGVDYTSDTTGRKTIYLNAADKWAGNGSVLGAGSVVLEWTFFE